MLTLTVWRVVLSATEDPAVTAWNAEQQHQQQQNRKSNARQAFTDLEDNAPT